MSLPSGGRTPASATSPQITCRSCTRGRAQELGCARAGGPGHGRECAAPETAVGRGRSVERDPEAVSEPPERDPTLALGPPERERLAASVEHERNTVARGDLYRPSRQRCRHAGEADLSRQVSVAHLEAEFAESREFASGSVPVMRSTIRVRRAVPHQCAAPRGAERLPCALVRITTSRSRSASHRIASPTAASARRGAAVSRCAIARRHRGPSDAGT